MLICQEILNKCFDDIEQFMIRLQSVSDAYKELEKRRKGHKKKAPQPGGNNLITCKTCVSVSAA